MSHKLLKEKELDPGSLKILDKIVSNNCLDFSKNNRVILENLEGLAKLSKKSYSYIQCYGQTKKNLFLLNLSYRFSKRCD